MLDFKVFEDKKIRTHWNKKEEDWYFSVVDVVGVLTDCRSYNNAFVSSTDELSFPQFL